MASKKHCQKPVPLTTYAVNIVWWTPTCSEKEVKR